MAPFPDENGEPAMLRFVNQRVGRWFAAFTVVTGLLAQPALTWAQDDTVVVLGMSLPLTGPQATLGQSARQGAQAYVDSVNKLGGVQKRQLKLTVLDDEFKPDKTGANMRLLASGGAVAVTSLIGGPNIAAAQPVAAELEMPLVGVMNGSAAFRGATAATIIPVRASFADEAAEIVRIYSGLSLNRFAVVFPNDALGKNASQPAIKAIEAKGIKPVLVAFERGATDFGAAAAQIDAGSAQVAVVLAPTQSAAALIAAMRSRNSAVQVVCMSVVDDRGIWKILGDKARGIAFAAVVPNPFDLNEPLVREYQSAMLAAGFKEFSSGSLEGYVNTRVAVEGVRRAGKPTRQAVLKALQSLSNVDLGGYRFNRPGTAGLGMVEIVMLGQGGRMFR